MTSAATTPPPSDAVSEPVIFHPERTHVFAGILMAGISFLVIGVKPAYLWWILIFPALFIYWALRARTTVGEKGIALRYAFRPSKKLTWDEIEGVGFKGASTLLRSKDGKNYSMPGVTFNSLPELAEASRGRIPDALTAGLEAQHGKVAVINQDGNQVLMTKEEHEAYLAERKAAGLPTEENDEEPDTRS